METLLEKITLKIYKTIDATYSIIEKISMLNKINNFYQVAYENDDYGLSFEILSIVNYHIAILYKESNNDEKYKQYLNYHENFKLELKKIDQSYKHSSLLFKNTNKKVNRKIINQIKKCEDKTIKNTIS